MATADAEGLKAYWALSEKNRETVQAAIMTAALKIPDFVPIIKSMSPAVQAAQEKQSQELQQKALVEGDWAPYEANLRLQAAGYARMGVAFSSWLPLFTCLRDVMRPILKAENAEGARAGQDYFLGRSLGILGDAYLAAKEDIITQQQEAIRELSTPVLQMREGMLILPIVGMVDTDRARKLTTSLLEAIRAKRARAVVMDITGVPIVDSKVANHIVQACEAARLMGARVILTGISAEIAQALVGIGAVLHGVQTVGDLQGGIELAEAMLGYQVQQSSTK
jgi:rsbT co-antagonist protein RsbR